MGFRRFSRRYGPASEFLDTPSEWFSSLSSAALYTSNAWYVYFNSGHVDPNDKSDPNHVRCVRRGP